MFMSRKESDEDYIICCKSNYEEKIKLEPTIFSREIIEYKEPKTHREMIFTHEYDFSSLCSTNDFSGNGASDYIVAFSNIEKIKDFEEKDVMVEFEKLKLSRGGGNLGSPQAPS